MRPLWNLLKYNAFKFCMIMCIFASLSACGIRPSNLDFPKSPDEPTFPRTYPNPQDIK